MARRAAYRRKKQNGFGMLVVATVIVMLLGVVMVKSIELRQKLAGYQAREQQLLEEIEKEGQRTQEIREYEKYTQTKQYIEEVAKDKLGLVYEGEIIFKDEN